jgi:hypothetical protein
MEDYKKSAVSMFHSVFKGKIFTCFFTGKQYSWLQFYSLMQNKLFNEYVKNGVQVNSLQGDHIIRHAKNLIRSNLYEMSDKDGFKQGELTNNN